MTETPDSAYRQVSVPDDDLPEDLQPGEDNPLAEASGDDADRQDLGDPHIDGLDRDEDGPVPPDSAGSGEAHHGAPDSGD